MKEWTIGKKLNFGFATILFLICVVTTYSSYIMRNAGTSILDVAEHQVPEIETTTAFEREILNARIQLIYYVTTASIGSLDKGLKRLATAESLLPKLNEHIVDSLKLANLKDDANTLALDLATYKVELAKVLEAKRVSPNGLVPEPVVAEWARSGGKLVTDAAELSQKCVESARSDSQHHSTILNQSVIGMAISCLFCVLLGGCISFLLTRNISGKLRLSALHLNEAAQQISTTSQTIERASGLLTQGATEQAVSIEETAASCETISSKAKKSSDCAKSMTDQMEASQDALQSGKKALEGMMSSVNEVTAANEQVSKIIKVIDEIAFRTNILALNAAVEAARAGEAGAGFAVVADEVRNLAQRSANAAKETAQLITESVIKTSATRTHVAEVAAAICASGETATRAGKLSAEFSVGSVEQTQRLQQISSAISRIEQVTKRVAAEAEESATAASELSSQAISMRQIANDLSVMVG